MKPFFLALLLLFGFAHAQNLQTGFKLALDTPQVVGLMLRSEWEQWGLRVTLGGFLGNLGYSLESYGYYRFASDGAGSGGYVGLGVGTGIGITGTCRFEPTPNPPIPPQPTTPPQVCQQDYYLSPIVAGLLGYEWRLGENLRGFVEARPAYELDSRYRVLPIIPLFGIGVLWLF